MREDLTGQRFGRLTVLRPESQAKTGRRYWLCRCDCGNQCTVSGNHLKAGHTKSCGCLRRQRMQKRRHDLTGQRFGRLTVLEPVVEPDGSIRYWKCRCDCGELAICSGENLSSGSTKSCGCLQEETRRRNMKTAIHFVEGTCMERIASKKPFSNNTSGCRGVYRRENKQWRAAIGFQGKVHNLGSFDSYDEAVEARKQAEKEIYGPLLEKYRSQEVLEH